MNTAKVNPKFWKNKRVFLTGHTGFKGSWLSLWLSSMGARVTGYALTPNTNPNLFSTLNLRDIINVSHIADIRDLRSLQAAMKASKPDIVIHMAAQPLVRYSYANPIETYSTNVMGTVHILEVTRMIESVGAMVVITTDKCYENKEWVWGYRETDPMGGYDPYSSSKGCAELVTSAYRQSYFCGNNLSERVNAVASARAGNVIGGGDWSEDRLIVDAIRAFESGGKLIIRNPLAIRPWQHVLEPLSGYLILAEALYEKGSAYASAWNFGPSIEDACTVQDLIELLVSKWGDAADWEIQSFQGLHEANYLRLDYSKAQMHLNWNPKWNLDKALEKVVQWHRAFKDGVSMTEISMGQINEYEEKV